MFRNLLSNVGLPVSRGSFWASGPGLERSYTCSSMAETLALPTPAAFPGLFD